MEKSPEAFRTISEVAEWLDVPTHVLRFWESRFSQVKPVKRAGGRRYYRPADMRLIGGIKKLLHDDGMTIRGVQKLLREEGIRHVAAFAPPLEVARDEDLVEGTVVDVPAEAAGESEVIALVREAAGAQPEAVPDQELSEAPDVPEAEAPEPDAPPDSAPEILATDAEPAPDEPPAAPGPAEEEDDAPAPTGIAPRITFGSVRSQEPALPFDDDAEESGPAETPDADAPPRTADVVDLHEAQAPPEPEPEPQPTIPPTPDVPDTDPEDESPEHARAPGVVARLIATPEAVAKIDGVKLEAVVAALRRARGQD